LKKLLIGLFILGALAVLVAGSFAFGYLTHRNQLIAPETRLAIYHLLYGKPNELEEGRFRQFRAPNKDGGSTPAAVAEQLESLGYAGGHYEAPTYEGVTTHEPERAQAGLNVYSSGHAPEAYLMNMEGEVLHTWRYNFDSVWPNYELEGGIAENSRKFWRRVVADEQGNVVAIHENIGILKVDKDSNLVWANQNGAHHDLFIHEDGSVYTLSGKVHTVPRWHSRMPILEDFISVINTQGETTREISILKCFEDSLYAPLLRDAEEYGDIFHTNTLKQLDGRHTDRSPIFKKGNLLVSLREVGIIAIIDPEIEEVVWALKGMWILQHEPVLTETGTMTLFDNRGKAGRSRVLEIDPLSQEILWSYGQNEGEDLFSRECGTSLRLPNGNTLITESDNGRALEVTPSNDIVWEFISPHRTGDQNELIATLTHVQRVPADFGSGWID
jgi:hypothetical protein